MIWQKKMKLSKRQNEVWGRLQDPHWGEITNNESLCEHVKRSKTNNENNKAITTPFCKYLMHLVTSRSKTEAFKHYANTDDMIQEGMKQLLISYKHFDPTKALSPYGYLIIIIDNTFIRYISKEAENQKVKQYIKEESELG